MCCSLQNSTFVFHVFVILLGRVDNLSCVSFSLSLSLSLSFFLTNVYAYNWSFYGKWVWTWNAGSKKSAIAD
jgi:hypothetical protein